MERILRQQLCIFGMFAGSCAIMRQRLLERPLDERIKEDDEGVFLQDLRLAHAHAHMRAIGLQRTGDVTLEIKRLAEAGAHQRIGIAEQNATPQRIDGLRQLAVLEMQDAQPDPGIMQ